MCFALLPSESASFFLPGLVHQFGNLLLTVQGHVLHLEAADIPRMQEAVLGAVQRGSASLQVVRALLGERTGAPGLAFDLLAQLAELGRVPSRERGLGLELQGDPTAEFWVPAEAFVVVCAEAVRQWVWSVPVGSSGTAVLRAAVEHDGRFVVRLGFELEQGSLPFPLAIPEVQKGLEPVLQACPCDVRILPEDNGIGISFAAEPLVQGVEA